MAGVRLRKVSLDSPEVQPLLEGLADEYQVRYGTNSEMSLTATSEFVAPQGLFVVLVADDVSVAGGGYRRHEPGVCEIKRMWTHPEHRRRGLARQVLHALEAAAAEAGYVKVVLETGPRQPEAEAMYTSLGYRRIPVFGPYEQGLAFEKELSSGAGAAAG
jgi:ribosomal protein S18 acetylase RimI-like enzyme